VAELSVFVCAHQAWASTSPARRSAQEAEHVTTDTTPGHAVWTDANGQPKRFVWREVTYSGCVLSWRKLSDKWWDADRYSDRTYFRIETRDHQTFKLHRDAAKGSLWILVRIPD
jgi:hypothetical protein